MGKSAKKQDTKKQARKRQADKKAVDRKAGGRKAGGKKAGGKKAGGTSMAAVVVGKKRVVATAADASVLDRIWAVVESRRNASPTISHSARLLSRGTPKIAQKFGEEAVECLIEATRGNPDGVVSESADVLYHLLVLWVDAGIRPETVWEELHRREGVSGIAEKASRGRQPVALRTGTTKIP